MAIHECLRGDRIVTAPATKTCPHCNARTIHLGKRSTFGIANDGRLICPPCWYKEMVYMRKLRIQNRKERE